MVKKKMNAFLLKVCLNVLLLEKKIRIEKICELQVAIDLEVVLLKDLIAF